MEVFRRAYMHMAGFTKTCVFPALLLVLTVLKFVLEYIKAIFSILRGHTLPVDRPSFIFGSYLPVIRKKRSLSDIYADLYSKYKGNELVNFFCFWKKQTLIRDLDIIMRVLASSFQDNEIYYKKDIIKEYHFTMKGDIWNYLRLKLFPVLSSENVKEKHSIITKCSETMSRIIDVNPPGQGRVLVEWHEMFLRYGLGVMLGAECCFPCDPLFASDSTLVTMFKKIKDPGIRRYFTLPWTNGQFGKFFKRIPKYFSSCFVKSFNTAIREPTSSSRTKGCLKMLVDLIDDDGQGCPVKQTAKSVSDQALAFIEVGSQAIASTMVFCLYELALNYSIQERLYGELSQGLDQPLSYEWLEGCEYLDKVISETLRKYPPIGFLQRDNPRRLKISGAGLYLEKGTQMFISIKGLQNDPDLFEKPKEFDPERFSKIRKRNIKDFSYMPFGLGITKCPGEHFALMTIKTGLAELLRNYRVLPPRPDNHPLEMAPDAFISMFAGGLTLPIVARSRLSKSKHQ